MAEQVVEEKTASSNLYENFYPCELCGQEYAKCKQSIKTHRMVCFKYICEHCGKEYSDHRNLLIHISRIHEDHNQYQCAICEKTFTQKSSLIHHGSSDHENKSLSFKCDLCNKNYSRHTDLSRHINNIHRGKSTRGILQLRNRYQILITYIQCRYILCT